MSPLKNEKLTPREVGTLGEKYLALELAKYGIDLIKLPSNFCCDFFSSNGLRIEVKTSTPSFEKYNRNPPYRKYWSFKLQDKQDKSGVDFFVLVCLNEKYQVEKMYIVPSEIIGERKLITIPLIHKNKSTYNGFSLKQYEANLEVIRKNGTR